MIIHIVKEGETLFSIANQYGVDPTVLAFDNDIADPLRLPVGQPVAVVFPRVTHTVQSGETLFSVAELYGTTVENLFRNNLFLNGKPEISPGQVLYIEIERELLGTYSTGGYAYPFINEVLLRRALPFMGALMPFTYGFRPDGTLISPEDGEMLKICADYSTQPVMHISTLTDNDNFSVELAESLFNSSDLQEKLLDEIIMNMQTKGYTALDVDFEFLGRENAVKYAQFVAYCRERLRPYGYGVMTALAPKTSDDQTGALYEGHDYQLLGEAADAVLLMTYEWGYTYGPPMAVSPIKPVADVVDYALTRIPPKKFFWVYPITVMISLCPIPKVFPARPRFPQNRHFPLPPNTARKYSLTKRCSPLISIIPPRGTNTEFGSRTCALYPQDFGLWLKKISGALCGGT